MTDDQLYGVDWRFTRYHHNYDHLFENDGNTIRERHATHSMMCPFDNLLEVQMLEKFLPMRKKITAHQISFPFEAFLWRKSLWLFVFQCPRHRHRPNPSPSQVLRRHPPATFQQQAEQRHQPTYLRVEQKFTDRFKQIIELPDGLLLLASHAGDPHAGTIDRLADWSPILLVRTVSHRTWRK